MEVKDMKSKYPVLWKMIEHYPDMTLIGRCKDCAFYGESDLICISTSTPLMFGVPKEFGCQQWQEKKKVINK